MRRTRTSLALGLGLAAAACAAPRVDAQAPAQAPARAAEATPLLAPARLATLPAATRAAWEAYLATSRAQRALDREAMRRELAALGRDRMSPAPKHAGFRMQPTMTADWLRGDAGRAQTRALLTWQTPSGGWSKRLDMSAPRAPGTAFGTEGDGWSYVPTIDNDATIEQLRYLGAALTAGATAAGDEERAAFARGVAYLLRSQLPSGCFPQVFPLQGSYHDAATFNDDATVNVLRLLQDVAVGRLGTVDEAMRAQLTSAVARGVECIVASQVVVDGARTAWGQQHDPLTLAPIKARSYELVGLAGKESANLLEFLMLQPTPDARVQAAVHGAAAWLRKTALQGLRYDYQSGLRTEAGAPPVWARLAELGTDRPIFSNRDGVKLYDWNQLTDRRSGYAWYSYDPASALRRYERWARTHPAGGAVPDAPGVRVTKQQSPSAR
ncbi:MAG: pectate lyase [Gemmatirosa sp.]